MTKMDLTGKTAIVTGGGSGIGRGIAIALALEGVKTVVSGRRLEPIDEVIALIQNDGGMGIAISADVSSENEVQHLVDETVGHFGSIDILVNNAGISGSGNIHEHKIETWDQVMAVNLRGPFLLARKVLPFMRDQGRGHIINISSESALEYYESNGAYGVSKHALNSLGEYIQRENQSLGIRVDTICPGMVVTPMSDRAKGLNRDKCLFPEDIVDLTLWLLTRRSNVKIGRPVLIQTMENPWQ